MTEPNKNKLTLELRIWCTLCAILTFILAIATVIIGAWFYEMGFQSLSFLLLPSGILISGLFGYASNQAFDTLVRTGIYKKV